IALFERDRRALRRARRPSADSGRSRVGALGAGSTSTATPPPVLSTPSPADGGSMPSRSAVPGGAVDGRSMVLLPLPPPLVRTRPTIRARPARATTVATVRISHRLSTPVIVTDTQDRSGHRRDPQHRRTCPAPRVSGGTT